MKPERVNHTRPTSKIIWIGIGLAMLYWILESVVMVLVFQRDNFIDEIFSRDPHEIWSRLGIIVAIALGVGVQLVRVKHKEAEEALRESETFISATFNSITDSIRVHDKEFNIIMSNKMTEQIYGTDIVGRKCYKAYRGRDEVCPDCPTAKVFNTGEPVFTGEQADQSGRLSEVSSFPVHDNRGNIIAVVEHVRDITERKRAKETLQEIEARYRDFFENAPIGFHMFGPNKIITDINQAELDMLGYSYDEIVGKKSWSDLLIPEHRQVFAKHWKDMSQYGAVRDLEYTLVRKDGRHVFVLLNASTRFDSERRMINTRGSVLEITERKRAEVQLLTYQEQLRSLASQLSLAEERVRRNIAMQIHDRLGQNLAFCSIQLGHLIKSASSVGLTKALGEIHSLIESLIDETQLLTFDLSPPLLYEVGLEAAVEQLTEQIQERYGIQSTFYDDTQPRSLDEDTRILLFQSIRELLINVAKHAQARNVSVYLMRHGRETQIIVEDDGVGFDTAKTSFDGKATTGFGLFSIRERLSSVGGHFYIESKPGHGTRATIAMPLKD